VSAYTGSLRLPKANPPVAVSITALQDLGGTELKLAGRFTDASVGNLASLVDIGGGTDLAGSMGSLQPAVDKLKKLSLMSTALAISIKENGGIEVTNASVMIGMPELNWQVFGDAFRIFLNSERSRANRPGPFVPRRG
jgi:hypothetical protein